MKLLVICMLMFNTGPKVDKVTISKTYPVTNAEKLLVMVSNVQGSILIEPSPDDNVHLDLTIEMEAESDVLLAQAKRDLKLGEYFGNDSMVFYVKAPFIRDCNSPPFKGNWWNEKPKYDFRFQYKLKIPKESMAFAKTVNGGSVTIKGIKGKVNARNVNGDVTIEKAYEIADASTVNGDVSIELMQSPKESIDFHTVNGDFNLMLPDNFAAKVYFDTMHGEMYSAFDYAKLSPEIEVGKNEKGSRFKIGSKTGVEIGNGGPKLSFKSINGNVYLKKLN